MRKRPPPAARPQNAAPRATAKREDGLHEALVKSGEIGRREDALRAKAFARVDASNAFVFHGCASVEEYGLRLGYGAERVTEYAAAGRVLALHPEAEAMLLDGSMRVSTLAIIEPLLTDPGLRYLDEHGQPMPGAEILAWARVRPDRELRSEVRRRKEDVRTGQQTTTRVLHLSAQGVDDLERTQTLVARKERRAVSQSEAAEHAFRDYVARHDLLEQHQRARRRAVMPVRADGGRHPRYVAAEVRRDLMRKHGDRCAIGHCVNHIWLENAHHRAHALGGGNERADQDRLCSLHHRMKDHGEITWVPDSGEGTEGHYRTAEGAVLELKARDPPGGSAENGPPSTKPARPSKRPVDGMTDRVRERAPPFRRSRRLAV